MIHWSIWKGKCKLQIWKRGQEQAAISWYHSRAIFIMIIDDGDLGDGCDGDDDGDQSKEKQQPLNHIFQDGSDCWAVCPTCGTSEAAKYVIQK